MSSTSEIYKAIAGCAAETPVALAYADDVWKIEYLTRQHQRWWVINELVMQAVYDNLNNPKKKIGAEERVQYEEWLKTARTEPFTGWKKAKLVPDLITMHLKQP